MMNTDCVYHCQDEKCSLDTHKIFGLFRTTCNENRGLDCKHKCSYNHPVVKDVIERIQKEARSDKKIEEVDDKFSKIRHSGFDGNFNSIKINSYFFIELRSHLFDLLL